MKGMLAEDTYYDDNLHVLDQGADNIYIWWKQEMTPLTILWCVKIPQMVMNCLLTAKNEKRQQNQLKPQCGSWGAHAIGTWVEGHRKKSILGIYTPPHIW